VGELKRKDNELTTADLAGRTDKPSEAETRPQLVRNEVHSEPRAEMRESSTDPRWRTGNQSEADRERAVARNESVPKRVTSGGTPEQSSPLFPETEVGEFRSRWSNIQTGFVDEPRRAVEDADSLVASVMKRLAEGFASERSRLEGQWDRGDNVSTEDLRVALQRYRSFFDRLLKV
jgi:hypothetical protein